MIPCATSLVLALVQTAVAPAVTPPHSLFEFPVGEVAARIARLEPSTLPAATPPDLGAAGRVPAVALEAWSQAATWKAWSALVEAEARTAHADPERRARLALLAAAHGRSDDAWRHFAAIEDSAWHAAILPRFLPGVPANSDSGAGGAPGALLDDVVLSPSLPPASPNAPRDGRVDRRAMSSNAIKIGAAQVSMRVSVEAEGVQIDVRHVAGESARFAVLLPSVPGFIFADEYVDWYVQDARGVPHTVEVKPGEAEHTIYGRFEPRPRVQPNAVPHVVPGSIAQGGLWFTIADSDPGRALVVALAADLEQRSFGFRCGVRAPHSPARSWSGVDFALEDRGTRAEKLAWLASAIEEFALQRSSR
ncbi:MAG: hypothetical protein JNL28_04530 [Planctomycetes bacterium]|nr:hypothetical protein [Planctomycetota bacterium]